MVGGSAGKSIIAAVRGGVQRAVDGSQCGGGQRRPVEGSWREQSGAGGAVEGDYGRMVMAPRWGGGVSEVAAR